MTMVRSRIDGEVVIAALGRGRRGGRGLPYRVLRAAASVSIQRRRDVIILLRLSLLTVSIVRITSIVRIPAHRVRAGPDSRGRIGLPPDGGGRYEGASTHGSPSSRGRPG